MKIRRHLHWFMYPLFFLACARQTTPTGGPKDTIPPKLVQSLPANGQKNFKSQHIELTFNEAVSLNNPKEELIITPDIGKDYNPTAKKNKVIISLQNPLHDTTTYSIKFREAVQDLTEKNSPPDLKLAFSTGDYIDSLSFTGKVFDPLTSKEIKNITVAIYKQDTFNIFKHKPEYFSKTDDKGNYSIANLKPGTYHVYAFEDKNKNLVVDSKSEQYGFLRETKQLRENIKDLTIPTVHLDARPLKITSARPAGTYYNIKTTKNLKRYSLTSVESDSLYSSFGEDQANIRVYNTLSDKDSIPIHFIGIDSINNKIDTTVYLKFTQRVIRPETLKASASTFQVLAHKGILTGTIQFNKPIAKINFDSILYRIDSTSTVQILPPDITIDSFHNIIHIKKSFDKTLLVPKQPPSPATREQKEARIKQSKLTIQNELYIARASFISIESDTSAKLTQNITPLTLETTGVIHVQIHTTEPNYVVQLLTKQNEIVQTKANAPSVSFEDLTPGDYQIRVVIDKDNDQHWTPGNYYIKQEPEQIFFYRNEKNLTTINLKANWELGPLLINF